MSGHLLNTTALFPLALAALAVACEPRPTAPGGADPFSVVRGAARELTGPSLSGGALSDGDDEHDDEYTCLDEEDCWNKCPEPQVDGGGTRCICVWNKKWERFFCTVDHFGPGELPEGGGGGGTPGCDAEIDGGELADGKRCDFYRCGDVRDTLAWEYRTESVGGGKWACHKFSVVPSKFIVNGVGIELGIPHGYYGYVHNRMTSRIPQMEAHFSFTARTTSGYRCPLGNKRIPKAGSNSHHIHGGGYDFVVDGPRWTTELKKKIVAWAEANGAAEANYYTDGRDHVHLAWH